MNKKTKNEVVKELDDFRNLLYYYAENRYKDPEINVSNARKQLNRMLPRIKKYIVQAKIQTQISGRAPMAMGGAPFTMDIFDDMFLNERTPLAVDLNNVLDAVDKCIGIIEVGTDSDESLPKSPESYRCGPLGNKTCNQRDFIDQRYSDKKIFLDIPCEGYKERKEIIQEVISKADLEPIVAEEILTSNEILCKVCKLIQICKYGISDISFDRHSVTYELGLMHGFGFKVCILLQETSEKFSDIRGLDHMSYASELELRVKLARWLEQNVPEVNIEKIKKYITDMEKKISEEKDKLFPSPVIKKKTDEDLKEQISISKKYSDERLEQFKAEIQKNKYFLLSVTPIPLINEIIDTNDESVKNIIRKPGYSRGRGWDMSYANFGESIKPTFDGIEKSSGHWKLRLFRNGYLEFVAEVNLSFSWSQNEEEFKASPRFNPCVVTEFPVSFMRLLKQLTQELRLRDAYILKMAYVNCGKYKLRPYRPNSSGYMFPEREKEATLNNWVYERIIEKLDYNNDMEAFGLIERFYNTFTFTDKEIPFFDENKNFEIPK